jgi:methanogenic corrinoid protein MtbC1
LTNKQDEIFKEIVDSIVNFDVESIKNASLEAVRRGESAEKVIELMGRGMDIVGKKYEEGEYFVPEVLICADSLYVGLEILKPHLQKGQVLRARRYAARALTIAPHDFRLLVVRKYQD